MTKLILLFIAYSVVMAILKKRAEKKAREQAAANGGAVDDDIDDIEYEAEAPPEQSRTRVMKGRPFLMSGEAAETSEDRNERPDPDRGERGPVKFERAKPEVYQPEKLSSKSSENLPTEKSETPARSSSNRGQAILDQLAKELGLPIPNDGYPQPSTPAPAPQPRPKPQPEVRPTAVTQPAPKVAPPKAQEPWQTRTPAAKTQAPASPVYRSADSHIQRPNLTRPDDVASALVLQAIFSEPPGLRYLRGHAARRPRAVSPEANTAKPTAS